MTYKYSRGFVFDILQEIIKDHVKEQGLFECSQSNISIKILSVNDVDHVMTLFIGPYREYRNTVLETFSNRMSALIYETGMKEEIISIMFAILLKEMKIRFSKRNSGYVFVGVEGEREEGVIRF